MFTCAMIVIAGGTAIHVYAAASVYREAPGLAVITQSGRLPPVTDRLPATPLLVQPVERVGRYGGVWHTVFLDLQDTDVPYRLLGYEQLVRWDRQWTRVIPNVAAAVEASADKKTYTFSLRPGMRWSDGVAFTAEDLRFWYEHVYQAQKPAEMRYLGEDLVLEVIDSHTVRFHFPERPHGLFLEYLASPLGAGLLAYPAHYFKSLLPDYNPAADTAAKKAGYAGWRERFEAEGYTFAWRRFFLGKPVLNAWVFTNTAPTNADVALRAGTVLTAVRNPYYWKIDTAGQQLPYLDQVEFRMATGIDEIVRLGLDGKLEMQYFYLSGEEHRRQFEAAAATNGFRLFRRLHSLSSATALSLNLAHRDPGLRRLLVKREFREALSVAINRRRLIEEVGLGMGEPYQVAPRPESAFYHDRLARQFTEHDASRANSLLDDLGCRRPSENAFRLRPDGVPLRLTILICDSPYFGELWRATAQRVAADWRSVGVEATVKETARRELYETKNRLNQQDAVIWEGEGGLDPILEPRYYLPISWESNYGIPWFFYWSGDKGLGQEPPSAVYQQFQLFGKLREQTTQAGQQSVMKQILDIAADQFYVLGIALQKPGFGIANVRLRNVASLMPSAWSYPSPGPADPFQFWLERSD